MKYMLLIYTNPASREAWAAFTEEERAEGLHGYAVLNEDLIASGEMIVGEALADSTLARHVSVTDGKTITTDGPFAEVKEHLAGFYLVDCESMERAVEIAARIPEAPLGRIEVRPILVYSGLEM